MSKKHLFFCFIFLTCSIFADKSSTFKDDEMIARLSRADAIPQESIDGMPDPYFEGYVQALIDMHFFEYQVIVIAKDHEISLANLPKNELMANSIVSFVRDVPGVKSVKVVEEVTPYEKAEREKYVTRPKVKGVWFPQTTELFLPLIAAPRQVVYSIGYRAGDHVVGKKCVPVSLGDDFPIFRWFDVFKWKGDLQIGIEAGIWSVFDIDPHPNPFGGTALVNTDFYVGIPLTYAINKWAYRLRVYHISSHLGDEYMCSHPCCQRVNPSFEATDFFISFQANDIVRLYGGPGFILHSDKTFPMNRGYVEYGMEFRFSGRKIYYHNLYGNVVAGANWRNWQLNHWEMDGTYVLGYEWSKMQGVGRKIRILGEFHHGYSLEGQFMKERTTYGSAKFLYGF